MATIKEVAKLAGVSTSTVSRTLSQKIPVDEETRARVLEAVRSLGYRPNRLAKGLKEGGSKTLALIVPNIVNPFFPKLVQCVQKNALERGYSLILCDSAGDERQELSHLESMKSHYVDGVLFSGVFGGERARLLREQGVPVVVVNRESQEGIPCVTNDNRLGAYTMINYLINKGHRRIACLIAPLGSQHYRQRFEGCLDAFREHGLIEYEEFLVHNIASVEESHACTRELLDRRVRPTAIFVFTDFVAIGVYSGIVESGLSIPGDISVAGFDDILFSQYLIPPLTTYKHPIETIASRVVSTLIGMIDGTGESEQRTEVCGELIERGSVRACNKSRT